MTSARSARRAIVAVSTLLFAASAAVTIVRCRAMGAADGMAMSGGWRMSMVWMRMPGQSWPGAAASFLGMWVAMMAAMMLPSLAPVLWRYRESVSRGGGTQPGRLTALVAAGYFLVWTAVGVAVFPPGAALAAFALRHPELASLAPIVAAVVVLAAGSLQLTAWKAHHLACWRAAPRHGDAVPAAAGTAWREGLRLGLECGVHGSGAMAVLLVAGIMDLRAMAVVTAALTAERLAPRRRARCAGHRARRDRGRAVPARSYALTGIFCSWYI